MQLYLNEAKVCRRFGKLPREYPVPGKFVQRFAGVRWNIRGKLEANPIQVPAIMVIHRLGKGLFEIEVDPVHQERAMWYLLRQCG